MTVVGDSGRVKDDGPLVYIGTYTEPPQGQAKGVYVCRLNPDSGALTIQQTVPGVANPSYLALGPNARHLYAVSEVDSGQVAAFSWDAATGHLTLLNHHSSHGTAPCHLSVEQGHVLVANYGSGSVAALPIHPDGSLGAATSVIQHDGSGAHPRQEGPHAHMILPDPDGQRVLAVDLGLDQIFAYRLDAASGQLTPYDPVSAYESPQPGAGPRQIAFGPGGRHAFVLNELDSTLTICAYDPARGVLRPLETISTLPEGFDGENTCAHVAVASSGRFVYASNRGHDSIVIFSLDASSGTLTAVGHEPTGGKTPRAFAIDPAGRWLLAANQDSDSILSFRVDAATGMLAPSGEVVQIPAPVCVVFADAPSRTV
ncbi:MAG: lactonase family protein [Chloroflexia bacterium]|nr:lactonase family protein [Chloroflexia bacterium]